MTVVSLRCHECDEVKDESKVEVTANGNLCHDCKTDTEIPDEIDESPNSDETEVSKESNVDSEQNTEDSADTLTESEDSDENAEGDKKPLEESFTEQDPLEW